MRLMKRILAVACLFLVFFSFNTTLLSAKEHSKEIAVKEAFKMPQSYKDPGAVKASNETVVQKTFSFIWNLIKYILILILAVTLAYYGVQGATKLAVLRGVTPLGSGTIKLLETTYLGQNKALHLVEIADEVFLISSSQNNIQLMTKIDNRDKVVETINQRTEEAPNIQAPFANVLDKIMERYKSQTGKPKSGLQSSFESTLSALKNSLAAVKSQNDVKEIDSKGTNEKGT